MLALVVALGVAATATMSTQAGDSRSVENVASVSAQPLNAAQIVRP
ncbi:MAG: hypothetical protein GXP17_05405 [Gammaproteobacteria bacterium]|nr:hypothetical protein [Gammaproteobacteria bacterium]